MDQTADAKFPRAFSYAMDEDSSARNFLTASSLADNFHLPLSPEALQEVKELQDEAANIQLSANDADAWQYVWGSKQFKSKKYYSYCFRNIISHKAFKWIWKSKCTAKLKFFCWLLFSDRLNTRNMLRRRKYVLNSGYNCMLCTDNVEETLEHLFFHCSFSKQCWDGLGITWQIHGDRLDLIERAKIAWSRPMFTEIFVVAAWSIWKERNNLLFNGITPSTTAWKSRFIEDFNLLVHRTKTVFHSFIRDFTASI